jgi:hypothetical protein
MTVESVPYTCPKCECRFTTYVPRIMWVQRPCLTCGCPDIWVSVKGQRRSRPKSVIL